MNIVLDGGRGKWSQTSNMGDVCDLHSQQWLWSRLAEQTQPHLSHIIGRTENTGEWNS